MWSSLRSSDEDQDQNHHVNNNNYHQHHPLPPSSTPGAVEDEVGGTVPPVDSLEEALEDADYVSASLASFVREAKNTLQETRLSFLSTPSHPRDAVPSSDSWDASPSPSLQWANQVEDSEDEQLKQEILRRFELQQQQAQKEQQTSSLFGKSRGGADQVDHSMAQHDRFWSQTGGSTSARSVPTEGAQTPLSPDLLQSPPLNPVSYLTDSQIKRSALEGMTPLVRHNRTGPTRTPYRQDPSTEPAAAPAESLEVSNTAMPNEHDLMQLLSNLKYEEEQEIIILDDVELPETPLAHQQHKHDDEEEEAAPDQLPPSHPDEADCVVEEDALMDTRELQHDDEDDGDRQDHDAAAWLDKELKTSRPPLDREPKYPPENDPVAWLANELDHPAAASAPSSRPDRLYQRAASDEPASTPRVVPSPPRRMPSTPDSEITHVGDIDETSMSPSPLSMSSPMGSRVDTKSQVVAAHAASAAMIKSKAPRVPPKAPAERAGTRPVALATYSTAKMGSVSSSSSMRGGNHAHSHTTQPKARHLPYSRPSGPSGKTVGASSSRLFQVTAAAKARNTAIQAEREAQQVKESENSANAEPITTKLSAEDGVARAKERVRQRMVKQRRSSPKSVKAGLSLRGNKPTTKFPTTSHRQVDKSHAAKDEPTLAQSSYFLQRGLRQDESVASSAVSSTRKQLTTPQAPHFATTDRHGEKSRPPSRGRAAADFTWAQSTELLQKELREYAPEPTARRDGLTRPESPKFHEISKRELPKSSAEKEQEIMQYFSQHPFKARPMPSIHVAPTETSTRQSKRRLTIAAPFHLRSVDRSRPATTVTPDHEQVDAEEMRKQFHARPMPKFNENAPKTYPRPTRVSTLRVETGHEVKPHEIDHNQTFRALPLPKSTYEAPIQKSKSPPVTPTYMISPPKLLTEVRVEHRTAVAETFRAKAEEFQQQRQHQAIARQREKLREAIRRAEEARKVPIVPDQPFPLKSVERHEAYRKELQAKIDREEAERRRQSTFHARPFQPAPPPTQEKKTNKRTVPEPFQLSTMARREACHEGSQRKAVEDELGRQASFKARPVPQSTYEYTPISPNQSTKPSARSSLDNASFSPEMLQSTKRAVERQAYNARAEQEREIAAARKQGRAALQEAQEQAAVQQLRRAPTSEGGMIPKAKPINAVFSSET